MSIAIPRSLRKKKRKKKKKEKEEEVLSYVLSALSLIGRLSFTFIFKKNKSQCTVVDRFSSPSYSKWSYIF